MKIENWVNSGEENKEFRQAVHTILAAVSGSPDLSKTMIMKGGILLALAYDSGRFTKDIDFSTSVPAPDFDIDGFRSSLDAALVMAVEKLGYGLDCRIQRFKKEPPRDDASFPTIEMTIGYAKKSDDREHKRLLAGNSTKVVGVDYSLNEPLGKVEVLELGEGSKINVYDIAELAAEKFRALLQQEKRSRVRRQDIFDLKFLLDTHPEINGPALKGKILNRLIDKSKARELSITVESMSNPVIRRKSQEEYPLLEAEIEGELPPFDETYDSVEAYYRSLPWKVE